MASEVGAVQVDPKKIKYKGRLQPGKMFLVDTQEGRIIDDKELKADICSKKPYAEWLRQNVLPLSDLPQPNQVPEADFNTLLLRQKIFGYTSEDINLLLTPMVENGAEAAGSMGNDTPLAVLSDSPRLLYDYFKQIFAQVSNPPVDAIREELVMSLTSRLGHERNILDPGPEHASMLKLDHPILSNEQLSQIREQVNASSSIYKNFPGARDMVFNLDTLSISTHAKAQDMADSNKVVSDLMPLINDPEALSRAVKEASIRLEVNTVENVLMPIVDKTNELSAKVIELAGQYEAGSYGDIKVRAVASLDKTVERLDRQYQSIRSTDPEALASTLKDLANNIDSSVASVRSVDPASQTEHLSSLVTTVTNSINTSDFSLFVNNVISIPGDVMMSSRNCVDAAFKDFTRQFGNNIESFFDPLLTFLIVIEKLLLATPWPVFLAVAGVLAWLGSRKITVAIGVMLAFFIIGFLDMWDPMISTVTMISAATLLCLAIGIPLGVWMSRSDRAQSMITPVLDIMQTIPSFVYLIPVVMMLGIGKVPGLIAVCIYAMPPIVRLTNLGIRLVDKEAMEAADAFGATYRQRLFMVQIPLALPNIFAGVNQTIMMALAMVVIASMIGVAGLGLPVLQAVQNQYLSMGMLNGLAIVALAIIFDRVSQAFGTRIQKHRSGDVL
jgi:glycine betaine/proline transport system permease protein